LPFTGAQKGVVVVGQLDQWCNATAASQQTDLSAELHTSAKHVRRLAREHLGMQLSWISTMSAGMHTWRAFDGDPGPFGLYEGCTSEVEGSYCARVVEGTLPNVIPDTRNDPRTAVMPVTEKQNLGAYIGTPIMSSQGEVYGMLCCVSDHAEPSLRDRDGKVLGMLAEILAEPVAAFLSHENAVEGFRIHVQAMLKAGGVSLALQPIVAVATGEVVGVEALARFASDIHKPEQWFDLAHKAGCGLELELDVISEVLAVLPRIPSPLQLGFNASPDLLASPHLADLVRASAEPGRLTVEITEHRQGDDEVAAGIDRLRRLGVLLAIDDAGAGYASGSRILRLAPDVIKLDRYLISGIDTDNARQAMIEALVSFSAKTGTALLAEGVETAAELQTLRRLGVGYAQGYYIGPPAPLSALQALRRPAVSAGP
jgi:EAL domain-containing protein (putative c-di-GMP-specific phosphodiesterase class I)